MAFKDWTKEEKRTYHREWARENRGWNPRKDINRVEIISEAKNVPCVICGDTHPECCMDLHHVDPSEKLYNIAYLRKNKPAEILVEEIKKCVTLCAHCHRKLHAGLVELPCVAV